MSGYVFDYYGFTGVIDLYMDEAAGLWPSPNISLPLTYNDPTGLVSISIDYFYTPNCTIPMESVGIVSIFPDTSLTSHSGILSIVSILFTRKLSLPFFQNVELQKLT